MSVGTLHTVAFVWLVLLIWALPTEIALALAGNIGWLLPGVNAIAIGFTAICCMTLGDLDG